jgi:undecaprenyl pyrophosphate phosphatase UppP
MSNSKLILVPKQGQLASLSLTQQDKLTLVQLISKMVGYGIICVSAILKVPQIMKIMKTRSVEGISKYLFYLDVSVELVYLCEAY